MFKTTATIALISTFAFTGLARSADPVPTKSPAASKLIEDETPEIQTLREARKQLNAAKDSFDKVPKDKDDHRREALEGIDSALKAIDAEIEELKAAK